MKNIIVLLMMIGACPAFSQQDPIYAQYLNNPLTINPAYAGINDQFSVRLQYRTQWEGIEANPMTANFSGNISFLQNRMGAGLVVTHDQLATSGI
jgi:type IX secretion system PorP/SprF family membrane protein